MKIYKILNNNAVVVKEGNQEKIVMGLGIAFHKRKNDPIDMSRVEKIFVMESENKTFQELLSTLPEEIIDLAQDIIAYAERKLQVPFNDHIHIGLTDHLAFAIERARTGQPLQNKLLHEIKLLYEDEFHIGLWGIAEIENRFGIILPEDEAANIALHLHTSKRGSESMQMAVRTAGMIQDVCELVEQCLGVPLDRNSLSYYRFVTHLRFALSRMEKKEPLHEMDPDILQILTQKYKTAYRCATEIARYLKKEYQLPFSESEVGYITLHIQRILDKR